MLELTTERVGRAVTGSSQQEEMAALAGRKRLEDTLSSPALTDRDNVHRLVSSQLAASAAASYSPSSSSTSSSASSSLRAHINNDGNISLETVQSRCMLVWNLLELLRSASGEENHNLAILAEDDSLNDGWKVKHDTGQLRVMYREGPKGTPYHTLLAEGFVNSPVSNALCLAWEAPSYGLWWPQMTVPMFKVMESRWIKRGFNGEDLSLIRVKVPWPLAAREVLLCTFELEVFEEDLIIVLMHSLPDTEVSPHGIDSDIPDVSTNVVRMEVTGGFALQRLTSEQSYFRTVANLDVKLDIVPPWFINFVSRQLIGLGFKLYEKTLLSMNTEGPSGHFQKLMETEPLYARVREGLESKKAEREMASRKEAAQKMLFNGHGSKAVQSSKLEEIEGSPSRKFVSFNVTEIAPASREEVSGAQSSSAAEQRCEAGVGVDPEVQRALDVLDKMISLVQSRKVTLMPYKNDDVGLSDGSTKHSVQTQCSDLASNGNSVELQKVTSLEQEPQRTQGPYVTTQTSRVETKHKWFCFNFSCGCFG